MVLAIDDVAILSLAYLLGKFIHDFLKGLSGNGHDKTAGKFIKKVVS